ncbi:EamA family transporter [Phyllobacterium sp. SB3]|uniref:EamA family transporter n=1 Tax=Phyllobacterium sp. SB3 TaxID=3156073 RepID=UPI0032AF3B83
MEMNYISWALLGMASYSATTLFVKLATRNHVLPAFNVLAVSVLIVAVSVWIITLSAGMWGRQVVTSFRSTDGLWTLAAGAALTIAVSSLFRALSLGPASVVVPIYGMFIVGGSVLGVFVLGEAVTPIKALGLVLAVTGVLLLAR